MESNSEILVRLYPDEEIVVGATTGQETIANAHNVFKCSIDCQFGSHNHPSGIVTKPTPGEIYESHQLATLWHMFNFQGRDINSLCWEQEQIIKFCQEHPDKFYAKEKVHPIFFLFKDLEERTSLNEKPLVVEVCVDVGGLRADFHLFSNGIVYPGKHQYRIIVPQLVA